MSFQASETHTFLMPDYYPQFSCKMRDCRSACCVGWPISISMQNYFQLLGMDCPMHLREKIDCGLQIYEHPSQERYACFAPDHNGDCPLRMKDGRCSLHAEMGENMLPDICRLYPRGIRIENGICECSCANSCEAVLELLFARKEPIAFIRKQMTVQIPSSAKRTTYFETLGFEQEIRLRFISVLQDRRTSLPNRILTLGSVLDKVDLLIEARNAKGLEAILHEPISFQTSSAKISAVHLKFGLHIAEAMLEMLDDRSKSIRQYGTAALDYFRSGSDELLQYQTSRMYFEDLFPNWEIFFEHWLVNHVFFSQFPFQDRTVSTHNEYAAVCALYALLRLLSLGWMANRSSANHLIDAMVAAFRLVDHTSFDHYAAHMLLQLDCINSEQLHDLIRL